MHNQSKQDPAAWLGKVHKVHEHFYTVRPPVFRLVAAWAVSARRVALALAAPSLQSFWHCQWQGHGEGHYP